MTNCLDTYCNTNLQVSTTVFITQGNYIGYMFRQINSHLQAYSLQDKSQDAVHTLVSQCVYISEIFNLYFLPRRLKQVLSPRQMIRLKYFTDVNTLGSQCVQNIL